MKVRKYITSLLDLIENYITLKQELKEHSLEHRIRQEKEEFYLCYSFLLSGLRLQKSDFPLEIVKTIPDFLITSNIGIIYIFKSNIIT